MSIMIVDNFFDNFNEVKNLCKNTKLYNLKQFNKKFKSKENWPGKRSDVLKKTNPLLFNKFIKQLPNKFPLLLFTNKIFLDVCIHLRLKNDKEDWIHTDHKCGIHYTLLIYLGKTNLSSGTLFYQEEGDTPSMTVKYIENRAVLFDSSIRHKSLLNYGNSIKDGRLTLNCFITKI